MTTASDSEHIFQRDLYFAHVGPRTIDPAEGLGGDADVGITPVRMVREVERLDPKLERVILDDPELLMGREIQLNASGCDDRVPPRRTEGPIRLKCEGGGVEPPVRISYAPGEDRVLACRIRPVVANACVGLVLVVNDSCGETAPDAENGSKLPASDDGIGNATTAEKPPPFTDRQVVEHRSYSPMILVEAR